MKDHYSIPLTLLGACVLSYFMIGWFMAKVSFVTAFQVAKPPGDVYGYLTDTYYWNNWMADLQTVERDSSDTNRFQMLFTAEDRTFLRPMSVDSVEAGRLFVFSVFYDHYRIQHRIRFSRYSDSTIVSCRSDIYGDGFFWRSWYALTKTWIADRQQIDYERLKVLVETMQ
ncbi:hypothetical protein K1X84_04820 [bacterium]|nr:hypothetical protein [bacterium]